MSIEPEYLEKIEAVKQIADQLTPWETNFFFGDQAKGDSPIGERQSITLGQKNIIDRVYNEKVLGQGRQADNDVVAFGNPRISAIRSSGSSFRVVIDDMQVGPVISSKEAQIVVSWLSQTEGQKHISIGLPAADAPEAAAE